MRFSMICRKVLFFLSMVAFVLTAGAVARAQAVAAITGLVTDSTGAVVPGVRVTLENVSTGAVYRTVTDAQGSYTISQVSPGPGYRITFSHSGFSPFVITGMYLNVNQTRTQNAKLQVGSTTQTVQVSAEAQIETLNTTDATIGNNFQVSMLNDLPVQNRDSPAALFYQQPGVTLSGAVTGARSDQSNVTLDGLEMNDNATGQFGVIIGAAPVDSVQEFRGVVGNPTATGGQGSGGQFELVTRSGTNHFHGLLNEYHRDTDTEANDWFNNNAGLGRPPLVRNQFGGNIGGPIWRNKAFFFFDYDGRRDARHSPVARTVPLGTDSTGYRGGEVAYVNTAGAIVTLNPDQVAALDPQGIGWDQTELALFQKRFPIANDTTGDVGDGVNTGGFRFNAPNPFTEDVYVSRIDYTMNDKMKFFAKSSVERRNDLYGNIQFPGDPTYTFGRYDRSYTWTVGNTWTINQNMVNQAQIGETHEDLNFPVTYNPQGANQYSFAGLSGPYNDGSNAQARVYPIPLVRDDFTWLKGTHTFSIGGVFKWETPDEFAAENYNFPSVGVNGLSNFTSLNESLRPADINPDATTIYDDAFSTALGAFSQVSSNYDYNNKGEVLKQGSGQAFVYRNYQTEIYFNDNWKITPNLTMTYGVRYQNFTVPYETHGNEAVPQMTSGGKISGFSFDQYWADRVQQSAQGISTNDSLPFLQYIYGGKANNAPGYYEPDNKSFAPHIAFAWNPSFDKNTVFSASINLVYDHSVVNALQFQQLQTSGLFEASSVNNFGSGDPYSSLASSSPAEGGLPRFAGIDSPPPPPTPPTITVPYTPYVEDGVPNGLPNGQFNLLINPKLKTPYSIQYNVGMQHQFPHGFILKMNYDARLGRRLLAEADASQLLNFPDNTGGSNQDMVQAESAMVNQVRQYQNLGQYGAAASLSPQPWFEDMVPGFADFWNYVFGGDYFANNTQAIAYITYPYPQRGDFSDMMYLLSAYGYYYGAGLTQPNVGMPSQYASNTVWTNKGFSTYNGLLVTLHKNAGYGLQFDLNYTWSHSIDNVSSIANFIAASSGYGFICDVTRPRECRGNSDFDVTNYFNGNFIYELPFGRGRSFAATVPKWGDEIIGGWMLSGIPTWHTGVAYNATSNAYVAGFANNAPATLVGPAALLKTKIHGGEGQPLKAFANSTAARAAFVGPVGLDIGSRNNLRGPGYFNMDLGLGKTFPLVGERVNLKFRCDAFNALNHPNFSLPSMDITQANGVLFGTITSTVVPPGSDLASRVLQLALRLEF